MAKTGLTEMEKSPLSSSQRIYECLEKMITDGAVSVNEKFPTEYELCQKYGVGRSTVREAMRMLATNGYVRVRRGSGTYVISRTGNFSQTIGNWLIDNKEKLRDYMDVRIAIEQLSVRLFIKKFSERNLEKIEAAQKQLEAAVAADDLDGISRLDEEFHSEIVKGTQNDLLININELLADSFREYRRSTFANKENRAAAVDGHQKILDAIRRRDTSEAVYDMREHLNISVENAVRQANF